MRRFYTGRYKQQPERKDATDRIYISFLVNVRIADPFNVASIAVDPSSLTLAFDSPGGFFFFVSFRFHSLSAVSVFVTCLLLSCFLVFFSFSVSFVCLMLTIIVTASLFLSLLLLLFAIALPLLLL